MGRDTSLTGGVVLISIRGRTDFVHLSLIPRLAAKVVSWVGHIKF